MDAVWQVGHFNMIITSLKEAKFSLKETINDGRHLSQVISSKGHKVDKQKQ